MNRHRLYTDEEIVAYLDGALEADEQQNLRRALAEDEDLQKRVAALTFDTDILRESFEPLLQDAPPIDLSAISTEASTAGDQESVRHKTIRHKTIRHKSIRHKGNRSKTRRLKENSDDSQAQRPVENGQRATARKSSRWLPFAAAASLLAAVAVGFYFIGSQSQFDQSAISDWRVAVADYQRLYVSETLPEGAPDAISRRGQLKRVSDLSGMAVTDTMVDLPNLSFRRAQTLGVDGQTLIQLAFATETGEPVALCFTPETGSKMPLKSGQIYDMNTVSWRKDNVGFVLMGRVPQALLDETASAAIAVF